MFLLNVPPLLANFQLYYQNLRGIHWNIKGRAFFDLHVKFEELYNDANIKVDEIAERILTLRYHPKSQYSDYLKISSLKESDSIKSDDQMVKEILHDHEILLKQMSVTINQANKANDEGTIDLIGYTQIM